MVSLLIAPDAGQQYAGSYNLDKYVDMIMGSPSELYKLTE